MASLCQTKKLVDCILSNTSFHWTINTPLRLLHLAADIPDTSFEDLGANNTTQNRFSAAIDIHRQSQLLTNATDERFRARLLSLTLPFAGSWLNAIPSKTLSLNLLPQEFRLMTLYRLGLPIHPSSLNFTCPACGNPSDSFADMPFPAPLTGLGLVAMTKSATTSKRSHRVPV
jgi:hypothetical protein